MRRPVVLAMGVLAALAMSLTAATAAGLSQGDGTPRDWMGSATMMGDPGRGGAWRDGSRGWMHDAGVADEFAYLSEMVAHHEEAVSAAGELRRSERAAMREFGEQVVRTQSAQIEQMRTWMAEWYPGRSTDVAYEPMMRDLTGLSGDELDRAFLRDMIPHHMAAVMMSQHLIVRGDAAHEEVGLMAASIRDEQHAEIFQMSRWLQDWFGEDWHPYGGMGMGMGMGMGGDVGRPMTRW